MKILVDFVLIIGVVLNLLALVGLLRIRKKTLPQYILVFFWILILDILLYFYADLHRLRILSYLTYYMEDGVRLLIPPLIFLYVKSIFLDKPNLFKSNLFHFAPFISYFILYTVPKSFPTNIFYIQWIDQYINLALIQEMYGIVYFILSLNLFYHFKRRLKENFSSLDEKDFLWIQKFIVSFLIVLIVDLILTITEITFGYNVSWDGYITIFFIIIAIGYLGYYGLTQSTIFLPSFLVEKSNGQNSSRNYLSNDQKQVLLKRFKECMDEEKLYLDPKLNLNLLAKRMDTSERTLSAFFYEMLGCSFYDSINGFRVNEAKIKLKSDNIKEYSIEGIGLSSGFSSKSSFYRVFKERTQLTPLAYRKSPGK